MASRFFVTICGLAIASSAGADIGDQPPPEAYLDPIDQQIALTGKPVGNRTAPCEILLKREEKDGYTHDEVEWLPTERCVKMSPPQRWKGLWGVAFEASQFCPEPAKSCGKSEIEKIWLARGPRKGGYESQLYRIEFEGRKTVYKGSYGHFGMYDHEIIVDRVISVQEVTE